jgi:uncharacterized protein (TIGR00730 family)
LNAPLFSVCVYCGSRLGADPAYLDAAKALGRAIASNGWRLVYGAGDIGLMGAVAEAATQSGAPTLGIIPEHLLKREAHLGEAVYGDRIVTETMHERKKVMLMNADAVVVLPGGAGSLDEFFEVLTWAQLGLHSKPIVLLNVAGYWDPLIGLIGHVIDRGFANPSLRDLFTLAQSAEQAIGTLTLGRDGRV